MLPKINKRYSSSITGSSGSNSGSYSGKSSS